MNMQRKPSLKEPRAKRARPAMAGTKTVNLAL